MKKVVITGSGGLLGSRLAKLLREGGCDVLCLRRDASGWDPENGRLDPEHIEGADAVVHLGGENIFGLWSAAKKERIRESRLKSTRLLAETMMRIENPPKAFLCASAVGIYGDRGDETLDEDSRPGEGFLPDLGMLWEGATAPAQHRGVRVVNLRIGIVLTPEGGALAKMLPVFRLGLGGNLGNGRMFMSWISLEDILRAIRFCIDNPSVSGPVNLVAPNPVTNADLTKALGTLLGRPTIFPVPSFLLKLAPGGMANEVLLASAKVLPRRLQQAGFSFQHPKLEDALSQMLSNSD